MDFENNENATFQSFLESVPDAIIIVNHEENIQINKPNFFLDINKVKLLEINKND